jgi:hypothetical protein
MGVPRRQEKVNLIAGMLSQDLSLIENAKKRLQRLFGPVDFESDALDFTHTDYYEREMGRGLKRKFLSFKKPVSLKNISRVKTATNALEKYYAIDGIRKVNVDPGYLDMSKLVLFSTKDYSHRIYLDKGIFAEVTLFYRDGKFNPWPWTYPDYRSAAYIEIFNTIRALFEKKRQAIKDAA